MHLWGVGVLADGMSLLCAAGGSAGGWGGLKMTVVQQAHNGPTEGGDYPISGLSHFAKCCSFRFSRPLGFPWKQLFMLALSPTGNLYSQKQVVRFTQSKHGKCFPIVSACGSQRGSLQPCPAVPRVWVGLRGLPLWNKRALAGCLLTPSLWEGLTGSLGLCPRSLLGRYLRGSC